MQAQETGILAVIPENIPPVLRARRQWLVWRAERRKDELTKVPYQVTGEPASVSDLITWTDFEECLDAYRRDEPHFDGLGFVFCGADPYIGLDLDKCRHHESGRIAPWAQRILDRLRDVYVEVSPSGRGLHVILEGELPFAGRRRHRIEAYSSSRFFCMTGVLNG
jgi:putative DNA primase/helicase